MLAHKATHEAKVAAEVIAGQRSYFDAKVIPSVAYTDPEVAWTGLTETDAKTADVKYGEAVFPWAASGRALSLARDEGLTKLLFRHLRAAIGAGLVGPNAGELIAELTLAIEMGADADDIGLTVHPHPTLSETAAFRRKLEGTITDLPRKPPAAVTLSAPPELAGPGAGPEPAAVATAATAATGAPQADDDAGCTSG